MKSPILPQRSGRSTVGNPVFKGFWLFMRFSSLDLLASKGWKDSMEWAEDGAIFKKLENVQKESYWLDFSMYAPQD